VSVDASIGLAIGPEDGGDVGQLVRHADVAMYVAKRARVGVVRYDSAADSNDANKLSLMTELRVAVERGELEVHYQPIVEITGGRLTKVEALVRWNHPTRGLLAPGAFVPLAEHTRLITLLNWFVLGESVHQCAAWRRRGAEVGVTVNVTVYDLLSSSYADDVRGVLRAASLPADALTIEITEGAFAQEPERVRRTLDALRARGVQVAIDDFGTGYSSLSYLKDLPVDVLKIDRSFVVDLPESEASAAIVAAAIELSHRLGLTVVAEGVEEEAQWDCLESLGCDLIQGFVVSRPVSAAGLSKLLEAAPVVLS
jgi:EAL domain-containing protein (putative c-di-GMP-specific phosphodiesterase class I)